MNFDIDKYSALVLVGGDGTIHEGLNGLLRREDGKKIPVGLLPNGSGDDACGGFSLEIGGIRQGLEYILKGDTIKVDAIKVLIDHNSEQELYESAKKDPSIKIEDYLRYSFINSGLCISANIARNAAALKPRLGSIAYTLQSLIELVKFRMERFDIEVDRRSMNIFEGEEEITQKEGNEEMMKIYSNLETQFMMVNNGKFGGGRILLNP